MSGRIASGSTTQDVLRLQYDPVERPRSQQFFASGTAFRNTWEGCLFFANLRLRSLSGIGFGVVFGDGLLVDCENVQSSANAKW